MSNDVLSQMTAAFKEFADSLAEIRISATTRTLVLQEIVCDLARTNPDPAGYIAQMLDRVSQRVGDAQEHPINARVIASNDRFFEVASRLLREG